jgi:hypothetical protein
MGSYPMPGQFNIRFAVIPGTRLLAVSGGDGVDVLEVSDFHKVRHIDVPEPVRDLAARPSGELIVAGEALYKVAAGAGSATRFVEKRAEATEGFEQVAWSRDASLAAFYSRHSDGRPQSVTVYAMTDGHVVFRHALPPLLDEVEVEGNRLAARYRHSAVFDRMDGGINVYDMTAGTSRSLELKDFTASMAFLPAGAAGLLAVSTAEGVTLYSATEEERSRLPFAVLKNFAFAMRAREDGSVVGVVAGAPRLLGPGTLWPRGAGAAAHLEVDAARGMPDGSAVLLAGGEAVRIGTQVVVTPLLGQAPVAVMMSFAGKPGLYAATRDDASGAEVRDLEGGDSVPGGLVAFPQKLLALGSDGSVLARTDGAGVPGRTVRVTIAAIQREQYGVGDSPIADWALTTDAPVSFPSADFLYTFAGPEMLVAIDRETGTVHRYSVKEHTELGAVLLPDPRNSAARQWNIGMHGVTAWALNESGQMAVAQDAFGVRVVDVAKGAVVAGPYAAEPTALAAMAERGWALALPDGSVEVWKGEAHLPLAKLDGRVSRLIPLPEKKMLIAAMEDGTNRFLDAATGKESFSLVLSAGGQWLLAAADGRFDESDAGAVGLRWSFGGHDTFAETMPIEAYFDDLVTPGLATEFVAGKVGATAVVSIARKERRTAVLELNAASGEDGKIATVKITFHAPAGVEIRNPKLKRNGILVRSWEGTYRDGGSVTAEAALVTGENEFTAYAFNQDDVKSEDAVTGVTGADALRRAGELWVLAVGVDNYANQAFQLNYATADARLAAWALGTQRESVMRYAQELLQHPTSESNGRPMLNFITDLTPSIGAPHVTMLLDEAATRGGILAAIRETARKAKPEDAIVVYFAGHGVARGPRYFMLAQDMHFAGTPAELGKATEAELNAGAVSDQDLRAALAEEHAANAAVIIDACQSGAVTGDAEAARRGPMNSQGLLQLAYDKGIYLLAASLSTQTAAEQASLAHGVLTYSLFEQGLEHDLASPEKSLAGGGAESLREWLSWVTKNLQTGPGVMLERERGSKGDQPLAVAVRPEVQQPRLFEPPATPEPLIVAVAPTPLDPLTVASKPPPGMDGAGVPATVSTSGGSVVATARGATSVGPLGLPLPDAAAAGAAAAAAGMGEPPFAGMGLPLNSAGFLWSGIDVNAERFLGVRNGEIAAINVSDGRVLWSRSSPGQPQACAMAGNGRVACVDQSGKVFVLSSATKDGKVQELPVRATEQLSGGLVRWVDRDTKLLVARGTHLKIIPMDGTVKSVDVPYFAAAAYDPETGQVFAAGAKEVAVFHVPELSRNPSIALRGGPQVFPFRVAAAKGGGRLAIVDSANRVSLLDTVGGKQLALKGIDAESEADGVGFAEDGKTLLVSFAGGEMDFFDAADGSVQRPPAELKNGSTDLLASADGHMLAAFSLSGNLAVWKDGQLGLNLPGSTFLPYLEFAGPETMRVVLASEARLRSFALPDATVRSEAANGHSAGFFQVDARLAMEVQGRLLRWDRETLKPLAEVVLPEAPEWTRFSPDGTMLAWTPKTGDPVLHLRNVATGTEVALRGGPVTARGAAFAARGGMLVALSSSGTGLDSADTLTLLSVDGKKAAEVQRAPGLPCCGVQISPDSKRLLLYSMMGSVALYDLEQKKVLRLASVPSMVLTTRFDPDGEGILLGLANDTVAYWDSSSTKEPKVIAVPDGVVDAAFRPHPGVAEAGFVVSSSAGTLDWFGAGPAFQPQATSFWNEARQEWITVNGDASTDVAFAASANPPGEVPKSGVLVKLVSGGR